DREEQASFYRALGKLGSQAGFSYLIERLARPPKGLFGRRKGEQEQLLAIQGLAEEGTPRSLRAIEEATLPSRGHSAAVVAAGSVELVRIDDGVYVNRQAVKFEAINLQVVGNVRTEMKARGIQGISAATTPPRTDFRLFTRLFTQRGIQKPGPRGDPARPFMALLFKVAGGAQTLDASTDRSAKLIAAYAHAVFFVDHTIQQLRVAGELIPLWAASRVVP